MKLFRLVRIAYIPDGTFGVLFDERIPFCLTLEREWKDNKRNISCIPTGEYTCIRYPSRKFGETFIVKDVPNRMGILFHKGNLEEDSHGCIIIGEEYGKLNDKTAVLSSGKGFGEFLWRLEDMKYFKLRIRDEN